MAIVNAGPCACCDDGSYECEKTCNSCTVKVIWPASVTAQITSIEANGTGYSCDVCDDLNGTYELPLDPNVGGCLSGRSYGCNGYSGNVPTAEDHCAHLVCPDGLSVTTLKLKFEANTETHAKPGGGGEFECRLYYQFTMNINRHPWPVFAPPTAGYTATISSVHTRYKVIDFAPPCEEEVVIDIAAELSPLVFPMSGSGSGNYPCRSDPTNFGQDSPVTVTL